jgi:uncharacterized membrane protein YheB (UPF0754 family)
MMNGIPWHDALLAVIIGGLTGRLVDYGAVQLLFRPYRPVKLGPMTLHGVLPARQDALAHQVANAISNRLLSEEALTRFITGEELAGRLRGHIRSAVDEAMTRDLPSIRVLLGELGSGSSVLDLELDGLGNGLGEALAVQARRPEIRAALASWLARFLAEHGDRRLDELVSDDVFVALERFSDAQLTRLGGQPDLLARTLESWLGQLGAPRDLLTPEAERTLRVEARSRIPSWFSALEETLRRDETVQFLDRYVLDAVDHFIEDLPRQGFLGEIVGWFIRTTYRDNKALYRRKILEVLPEQVQRFRERLNDPNVRDGLENRLSQFLDDLLMRPIGERIRAIPADLRDDLRAFVNQAWGNETTQASLRRGIGLLWLRLREATLQDLLPSIWESDLLSDPERAGREGPVRELVDHALDLVQEGTLRGTFARGLSSWASLLLDQPIGRLEDRLGRERSARLHAFIETQVLAWAQREAPRLAQMFDVRSIIEDRVRAASAPGIEAMVKSLARRELNSIFTKGLFGGVLVSTGLTTFLLGLERLVESVAPGTGWLALGATGFTLMGVAAWKLRIPEPREAGAVTSMTAPERPTR